MSKLKMRNKHVEHEVGSFYGKIESGLLLNALLAVGQGRGWFMKMVYVLLAMAGGVAIGIQTVVNGGLGKKVGTVEASFLSFFIGTAALFFVVLFLGKGNMLAVSEVPKVQLIGGLLGAFYVFTVIFGAPNIGVVATLMAVIIGQLFIGSIIDHFGLFGGERYPLDVKKGVALLLMIISVYLFNK